MSLSARTDRAGRTRRARARLHVEIAGTMWPTNQPEIGAIASHVFRKERRVLGSRSCRRTIARFMLAPRSASSMLFASLRPGRWPGLRALTTPPRGTSRALTRWGQHDDHANEVDARIAQAYVGVITSVPHGTPSVRRNGQRSAYPVGALKARHRARTSPHRSPLRDLPRAVGRHTYELRTS